MNSEQKIKNKKPDIRRLEDMKGVLHSKEWAKKAPNFELYYMYRGIEEKDNLRYDITVIPPRTLGNEFVKTKGHEHCHNFQELYTVLEGEAIFLMQKQQNKETGKIIIIEDVFTVKAKQNESVIVPPGYGHVTINPGNTELKLSNWVSKKCISDYKVFEKLQGACYYYTKSGWIKNKNYAKVPDLRFEEPLKSVPTDLSFLN